MARPANADAAATRRRILDAARALFAERGVDGASIRQIAASSEVSLAMVHHYYGSKDALHAACVDSMYEELLALQPRLLAAIAAAGGSLEALADRVVREAFRFARAHQIENRMLLRHVVSAGELDEDRRRRGQEPFLDRISALLAPMLGTEPEALRLPLQSASFLIARWAASSPRELELVTGKRGRAAVTATEDQLVTLITAMFQGVSR
jgi:AcrR family transcriptional regulator